MKKINIPYGQNSISIELPEDRINAVLVVDGNVPADPGAETQEDIIYRALQNPIGSSCLSTLVKGKKNITIISSDHTRPLPSHITMPILLKDIRKVSPDAEITILIATGLHRKTTPEEIDSKYGAAISRKERIIVHDCYDYGNLRRIGTLPSGGKLELSTIALDADLLIAEGFIEPHFFAGFSGGRKSILPGIASYDCVVANHCSEFISHEKARTGVTDGNPIHGDMVFAAKASGLAFILNVLVDENHRIIDAVAGNPGKAHDEGCQRSKNRLSVKAVQAPIVVSGNGGYPLDQNLYQLAKAIDTSGKCCCEGGAIIVIGECSDGIGGDDFYNDFASHTPGELLELFSGRGREETQKDQWQSQILAKTMAKHKIIVISSLQKHIPEEMGFIWAADFPDALSKAEMIAGKDAKITVIPDGVGIIITQ